MPDVEFHFSYGQATKENRKALGIKKTHANDAYALGTFHPKWRAHTVRGEKRRRNNRIPKKFYDAKYVDRRGGEAKSGSEFSLWENEPVVIEARPANERVYRAMRAAKRQRRALL